MTPLLIKIGSLLLPRLLGKEISDRLAKIAGIITLVVALLAALALAKFAYDRSVVAEYEAERQAEASQAREDAADQRADDTIRLTQEEKELHDVIEAAPQGGTLSPAARALACERLRRAGRIPPACGPQGGNGSEAGTD